MTLPAAPTQAQSQSVEEIARELRMTALQAGRGWGYHDLVIRAANALSESAAALRAERERDRWMPIETAPKSTVEGKRVVGRYFLAYCPDATAIDPQSCISVCWWEPLFKDGKGCWWGEADVELRPTHWQPLPPPPAPKE